MLLATWPRATRRATRRDGEQGHALAEVRDLLRVGVGGQRAQMHKQLVAASASASVAAHCNGRASIPFLPAPVRADREACVRWEGEVDDLVQVVHALLFISAARRLETLQHPNGAPANAHTHPDPPFIGMSWISGVVSCSTWCSTWCSTTADEYSRQHACIGAADKAQVRPGVRRRLHRCAYHAARQQPLPQTHCLLYPMTRHSAAGRPPRSGPLCGAQVQCNGPVT